MKASICSEFSNRSVEEVDAIKLVDTLEQADISFKQLEKKTLEQFIKALRIDEIDEFRAIEARTVTNVKTDYRSMAEQEPAFFKNFVHQRCLKQAALGIESSEGHDTGKLKNNKANSDIQIGFVEG